MTIDDAYCLYYDTLKLLSKTKYGYLIPPIDIVMRNLKSFAKDIVYFSEDDPVIKKFQLGPNSKGLRNDENRMIYVRDTLTQPLRDITLFHELHHAAQSDPYRPLNCGLWLGKAQYGRLMMEGQTQYFAEEILFNPLHNITSIRRYTPGPNLRMEEGQSVYSSLHNYEHYDAILSKLAIVLDMPKVFFVCINYNPGYGLIALEDKYKEARRRYDLPFTFAEVMYYLDYFYTVDILQYSDNEVRDIIASGNETSNKIEIHPDKYEKISRARQTQQIKTLDTTIFDHLLHVDKEAAAKFKDYIFDDEVRQAAETTLSSN